MFQSRKQFLFPLHLVRLYVENTEQFRHLVFHFTEFLHMLARRQSWKDKWEREWLAAKRLKPIAMGLRSQSARRKTSLE